MYCAEARKAQCIKMIIFIFAITTIGFSFSQIVQVERGIISGKAKFYSAPKLLAKKLKSALVEGDTVEILNESTKDFYKIRHNKEVGWVRIKKITQIIDPLPVEVVTAIPVEQETVEKIEEVELKEPSKQEEPKKPPVKAKPKPKPKPKPKTRTSEKSPPKTDNVQVAVTPQKSYNIVLIVGLISLIALLSYLLIITYLKVRKMEKRYKPVVDLDKEVEIVNKGLKKLKKDYSGKKDIYDKLRKEVDVLSDDLEMMSHGLYEPKFSFDTSDQYKDLIKQIRQKQKTLIREKRAVPADIEWTVGGSKREGKKLINRMIRIALRAFNGECDAIMSKVRWNNIDRMEARIGKSNDAIDKLLETHGMSLSFEYFNSKIEELYATHEHLEKKHDELEEKRRVRKEEREEKKVQREIEKAKIEAEKEEKLYNEALEKARAQLGLLSGDDLDKQQDQIAKLEEQLKEALETKERAISRAQKTKSGHVYVISNIGSFGKDVYKIGLTRRLDPEIRVKELGDASVPFAFDIHAMIFSEDAPALEHQLHEKFDKQRVNLVNTRKEYFNFDLDEIKEAVLAIDPEVDFISTAESREYKETKVLILQAENRLEELKMSEEKFPESI